MLDVGILRDYLPLLLRGCAVTMKVSVLGAAVAMAVGVIVALVRVAPIRGLRVAAQVYIQLLRGIPVLVIIYFAYFGLPSIGIALSATVSAVAALGISSSAYIAEALRGGIESIPRGQVEAGRALGIGYVHTMQRVVLPQIFLFLLPTFTSEFVILLKASSLTSIITVRELTWMGQAAAGESFADVQIYLMVAGLYLLMNSVVFRAAAWLERRWMA